MDKKEFYIDLDATFSIQMCIKADNAEDAKKLALKMMKEDPYYRSRNRCYVESVITDCFEV